MGDSVEWGERKRSVTANVLCQYTAGYLAVEQSGKGSKDGWMDVMLERKEGGVREECGEGGCGECSLEEKMWKRGVEKKVGGVWWVECGGWSVVGGVWCVDCGGWSVVGGVWWVECGE